MVENSPEWLKDISVTLLPYDLAWKTAYEEHAKSLEALLGEEIATIQHVGSTSIPDMVAKPLIDILVEVKSKMINKEIEDKLLNAGYIKKTFASHPDPLFMMGIGKKRTFNIHVCGNESLFAKSLIHFRDTLCENEKLKQEYIQLKLKIIKEHADDRQAYYHAKETFLNRISPRV